MRALTELEGQRLGILTENSVSLTLIEPTQNGLRKSIMDATGPVRNYLRTNNVHDFSLQSQGPEHKVLLNGLFYTQDTVSDSIVSLYRPRTKEGDPRVWFSGLAKYSNPNDIIGLLFFDEMIHIVNITQLPVKQLMESSSTNPLKELINEINRVENIIADELLTKLRVIAQNGPIRSIVNADTSVGRTLETALGIKINSSREPDYKGIELKSFRSSRSTRKNLFAQVPNWEMSKFKSSTEIVNAFGYWREGAFKLYCTVSAIAVNSQGLYSIVDTDLDQLIEASDQTEIGEFAVWTLDNLHSRLLEKHKETFWVSADSILVEGIEHFQYRIVEHTRKPIITQFDILLEQGIITFDHVIKKNARGRGNEKGPLFKIQSKKLGLLFPPSLKHDLLN